MSELFRRFAEVPGFCHDTRPTDLLRLPYADSAPVLRVPELEGNCTGSLSWQTEDSPSASPWQRWKTEPRPGESPAEAALRDLQDGFERPGSPRSYHFAIQHCSEALWKFRRDEPWVMKEVEVLCWLDIQLLEAYPFAASAQESFKEASSLEEIQRLAPSLLGVTAETEYDHVHSFDRLIKLYESEGYLEEAVDVARRAVRFNQAQNYLESLQARIAQLEAEDAK